MSLLELDEREPSEEPVLRDLGTDCEEREERLLSSVSDGMDCWTFASLKPVEMTYSDRKSVV